MMWITDGLDWFASGPPTFRLYTATVMRSDPHKDLWRVRVFSFGMTVLDEGGVEGLDAARLKVEQFVAAARSW